MNEALLSRGLDESSQAEIASFIGGRVDLSAEFRKISDVGIVSGNFDSALATARTLEDYRVLSQAANRGSFSPEKTTVIWRKWSDVALSFIESAGHPLELIAIMILSPHGERAFVSALDKAVKLISEYQYGASTVRKVIGWAIYYSRVSPKAASALIDSYRS